MIGKESKEVTFTKCLKKWENKQGSGCVLATPGKGQSFKAKMSAEELRHSYPNIKTANINPEDVFKECNPHSTEISMHKESDK